MLNLIDSGFIKLQRKILDWEWYNDIPTKTLFIHLLLKCNFKDKKWRGYDIEKGQILTGRKILSDETGLSEQQIKTALKKLQATNEITIKSTNKFSIITLVKYSFYQDKKIDSNQLNNQAEEQQSTNNQPTSNQQATTTKNEKNVKNENKLIVQKENPFADMTKEFLQVRYKQMRKEKTITQKDFDNIRRLIEIDLKNRDNPVDDVKKAMDCVNKNSDKEFFPAIESSKAFREKFTKIESYIKRNGISNQQNSISKEEDKKRRLKAINEIADKKLFSSCQQLQSNDERVFFFVKDEDDEKALRSLPENKRNEIKAILGDLLTDKELSIQIANFHIN